MKTQRKKGMKEDREGNISDWSIHLRKFQPGLCEIPAKIVH